MIKVLFIYKSNFVKCAWHDFLKTEVSKKAIKTLQMNCLIDNSEHKIDFEISEFQINQISRVSQAHFEP